MLARMLPKPLLTVEITSSVGMPQTRPTTTATTTSTRNGCWLNFEIAITMATTANTITANMKIADILSPSFS